MPFDRTYCQNQFALSQMRAMRVHAEIVSGAYRSAKTQQGREPTDDERARGVVIGWRDLTDDEKLQNKIEEMNRHIQCMQEWTDESEKRS